MNALIVGATGLCGSAILRAVAADKEAFGKIHVLARRAHPEADELEAIAGPGRIIYHVHETNQWSKKIPEGIHVLFSALGVTKAASGGLDNQYKIDHDLTLEVARTAKEKGCRMIVLVSSIRANDSSYFPYFKMKGQTETDVILLSYDRTFILRPGPLLGDREKQGHENHKSLGNTAATKLGHLLYRTPVQFLLGYPIFGNEVGKVAAKLAATAYREDQEPTIENSIKIVHSSQILKLALDDAKATETDAAHTVTGSTQDHASISENLPQAGQKNDT